MGSNLFINYGEAVAMLLFGIGFGNLLLQPNLIKKIIGLNIMDTAVYLFLAEKGYIAGRVAPIVANGVQDVEAYINPIPSGLVLTGIVVSVSVSAPCYKIVGNKRIPVFIKPLEECRNLQKQKRRIKLRHRKLTNIRNNYLHQTTTEIVKTKPSRIVMERLNVKGMMKNRHLAKAIQKQKFYEFKRQIAYKCQKNGIEMVEVPTFYPSSKTCSCCGCIRSDLKLSDRVYRCNECGLVIDRDLNASLNLAKYQSG